MFRIKEFIARWLQIEIEWIVGFRRDREFLIARINLRSGHFVRDKSLSSFYHLLAVNLFFLLLFDEPSVDVYICNMLPDGKTDRVNIS